MGKTKIHTEEALYELGDEMSVMLKKKFDRHNYNCGENRKLYKEAKYKHVDASDLEEWITRYDDYDK